MDTNSTGRHIMRVMYFTAQLVTDSNETAPSLSGDAMWSLSLEILLTWQDKSQHNSALRRSLDWMCQFITGYLSNPLNKESRAGNIITRSLPNCLVGPSCDQVASSTRTAFLALYHRILTWGSGPDIIYFQICRFPSVWQCRHCDKPADLVA